MLVIGHFLLQLDVTNTYSSFYVSYTFQPIQLSHAPLKFLNALRILDAISEVIADDNINDLIRRLVQNNVHNSELRVHGAVCLKWDEHQVVARWNGWQCPPLQKNKRMHKMSGLIYDSNRIKVG